MQINKQIQLFNDSSCYEEFRLQMDLNGGNKAVANRCIFNIYSEKWAAYPDPSGNKKKAFKFCREALKSGDMEQEAFLKYTEKLVEYRFNAKLKYVCK